MESSVVAGWVDFLGAVADATGALAGLVFVALSINLTRILKLPGAVGRAAETLLLLAGALVGALLALAPHRSLASIGLVVLGVGAPMWCLTTGMQIRVFHRRRYHRLPQAVARLLLHQAATLPFLVGGVMLLGSSAPGMHWFAAGLVLSMVAALINAWILLVEILR